MAKKAKNKEAKAQNVEKKQSIRRKKILRSEYEKMQQKKINYLLGEDEQQAEEQPKKGFFERVGEFFLGGEGDEKLMLVKARKGDLPSTAKLGFSLPYTTMVEIISVVLLALYIAVIFTSLGVRGSVDIANLFFVIVAHFMTTVTLAGIDTTSVGDKHTMLRVLCAFFHWGLSSCILFGMNLLSSENVGIAIALQLIILAFSTAVIFVLSSYRRREPKYSAAGDATAQSDELVQ